MGRGQGQEGRRRPQVPGRWSEACGAGCVEGMLVRPQGPLLHPSLSGV